MVSLKRAIGRMRERKATMDTIRETKTINFFMNEPFPVLQIYR
jgi:hypothetical protein